MRVGFAPLCTLVVAGTMSCQNVIVGTPTGPRSVPLRVHGDPADATVTLDDQRIGSLALIAARGMRVVPGKHRISVEAAGYLPWDRAFEADDAALSLDVHLVRIPD